MASNTPTLDSELERLSETILDELERLSETILDAVNNNSGNISPTEIGRLYIQLGNLCFKSEDFETARGAYAEALRTLEIADGVDFDHPYVAASLGNLGAVQWRMGDYESAEKSMEKFVCILRRKSRGSDEDVTVAATLHNLGTVKLLLEDYEGAVRVLQRALYGRIKVLGRYHEDVAETHDKLGLAYAMIGDAEKSKKHHRKAMRAKVRTLGQNHPSTVVSLLHLARVHSKGNHDVAIQQYREAFEEARRKSPEVQSRRYDTDTAIVEFGITTHIIGVVHLENESYFEAFNCFRQALSIFEEAGLKSDDERILAVHKNVSEAQKRLEKSELLIHREAGDTYADASFDLTMELE